MMERSTSRAKSIFVERPWYMFSRLKKFHFCLRYVAPRNGRHALQLERYGTAKHIVPMLFVTYDRKQQKTRFHLLQDNLPDRKPRCQFLGVLATPAQLLQPSRGHVPLRLHPSRRPLHPYRHLPSQPHGGPGPLHASRSPISPRFLQLDLLQPKPLL